MLPRPLMQPALTRPRPLGVPRPLPLWLPTTLPLTPLGLPLLQPPLALPLPLPRPPAQGPNTSSISRSSPEHGKVRYCGRAAG